MKRLSAFLIILVLSWFNMSVSFAQAGPKIVATPECLVFYTPESGGSPASQTFKISNGGEGTLNYTLSTSASWFSLNKTSGSVTTNKDTITVSADASGLSESQSPYTADITITNTDEPAQTKIVKARLSIISSEFSRF